MSLNGYPCPCDKPLVGDNGMLKSNTDIAGLGVLIGLMIPAVFVFILIVLYYLFAVDDSKDSPAMCTKLDLSFLRWWWYGKAQIDTTYSPLPIHDLSVPSEAQHIKTRLRWRMNHKALENIILSFSDAQLVNAFSLLLSEFTLGCRIDAFHWQVLVQCVWFASATHLAAIPILKAKLQEARNHHDNRRGSVSIYIRAILMTLVLGMLVASLIPTGHPRWLFGSPQHRTEGTTSPALCFFDYNFLPEKGDYAVNISGFGIIWLGWSIGLVTITYARRIYELLSLPAASAKQEDLSSDRALSPKPMKKLGHMARFSTLFAHVSAWVANFRQHHLTKFTEKMNTKTEKNWLTRFLWNGIQEVSTTIWRLLESFVWHIVWLFMMMIWNMYLLIYNKWYFNSAIGEDGDQAWGFGQSMPLIILILPLVTIIDAICDPERVGPLGREHNKFLWKEVPEDLLPAEHTNGKQRATHKVVPVICRNGTKKESQSTRITVFLIFEFALLFGLLASVNFIATVTSAGTYAGTKYLCLFLLCLVSAPLVFTYTIHLPDAIFKRLKVYENMWLRSIVAFIVALTIGAGMSYYFVQPFIADFGHLSSLEQLPSQGLNADCFYWNLGNTTPPDLWISNAQACLDMFFGPFNLTKVDSTCFQDNQTSHTTWLAEGCVWDSILELN